MLKQTIQAIMIKSHAEIHLMIHQLIDRALDPAVAKKMYQTLKERLERHILVEEKSIFRLPRTGDIYGEHDISENIRTLYKQHVEIKGYLNDLGDCVDKDCLFASSPDFLKVLTNHQMIENRILYPFLDDTLPEDEKEILMKELADI